ncbi:class I SAM-dependent methyltransferase [Maridesulfovibrio zosterae]|uniref:class I SAM-dependent methyltransferase n=1 Tax=Maridesulfovibrio zosterae TaxID=82171 RepID=UPI00040676F3|nr:class I SAM-dependent methyltransferase [Maridesulfovibrio zosterae]
MSNKSVNKQGEERYENVFGDTFAMYTRKEMEEFIEPFRVRFDRNGLDARKIFAGKKCFDAGCGNGRGSLFMLMNGAAHVTSYDFSKKNIQSTRNFLKEFGYSDFDTMQGSLENIPFDDQEFDFVWCNGVIMHTEHPNECLKEISRILKTGGNSWLYIYGSGGVYWNIIYHFRKLLEDISIEQCIAALKLMRYETRYIAEFIDDWYATFLRTYTDKDLSARLKALGFEDPELLKYGMDYDTSHRRNTYLTNIEKDYVGEGDLRYLLSKKEHSVSEGSPLRESEYGSDFKYPDTVTNVISPCFEKIQSLELSALARVALAAHIQRELRLLLDAQKNFEIKEVLTLIESLIVQADIIKDL